MASDEDDDIGVDYNPDDFEPASAVEQVKHRHEASLLAMPSVTGVGIGRNAVGDDAIVVYLEHSSAASSLPRQIEGVEVVTEVTGIIDAQ